MARERGTGNRGRRAVASALLLPGVLALGCAGLPMPTLRSPSSITEEELREDLLAFAGHFSSIVSRAGDRIRDTTAAPEIRKRVLLWRIRLVPLVQEAAALRDPQEAFVAVNGLVVMMRRYLTEGDGATLFGPEQPFAVEAARQLEEDFYRIALQFLNEAEVERLRAEIDSYSAGRVISGSDFTIANVQRHLRRARESGSFDWVIDWPMSPFRALEGVGSGAAAIHDFNDTALRFSRVVEGLPEQLRWQSELLLYDAEGRESLVAALAAVDSFAESARRLSAVAERLPADLGAALAESEGALAQANRALESARGLVEPLRATAEQVNLAGGSWAALFASDGEPDPDARPFDIREVEATARGVGEAAAELRGLAGELAALVESRALEAALGGVDSSVALAESGGRGVVDHAAWRGLQLLVAFFALLLAYRWAAPRLGPRAG